MFMDTAPYLLPKSYCEIWTHKYNHLLMTTKIEYNADHENAFNNGNNNKYDNSDYRDRCGKY